MDNREMAKVLAEMQGWELRRGTFVDEWYDSKGFWCGMVPNIEAPPEDGAYNPATNVAQAFEALKHWGPGRMWRIEKTSAEVIKVLLWDCDGIPVAGTDGFDLALTVTRALVKAVQSES